MMGVSGMMKGTVKWFDLMKGYGFIQPDDGSRRVYVHQLAVERAGMAPLYEGQKVSFEVQRGEQGAVSLFTLKVAWLVPQEAR